MALCIDEGGMGDDYAPTKTLRIGRDGITCGSRRMGMRGFGLIANHSRSARGAIFVQPTTQSSQRALKEPTNLLVTSHSYLRAMCADGAFKAHNNLNKYSILHNWEPIPERYIQTIDYYDTIEGPVNEEGLTEQGQAVRGELEHRGCSPQLLRSFPSLAATSIPRAPSPSDRNKAAGREARRQGTKSGTFSLQGTGLTGGLPLLRVKVAQPEVRLAEVAAIVALLPIWEVDGLAHLHPYLREELGGGDEALVVCPEGFVGDDRVESVRGSEFRGIFG
ncbi:hypothetical protein C8F04DRAFT_1197977 [Mycena alexandri]|uniref:Uncharacterized protein n=1 Tax=Mycena alexandri TaxID=1745969 RepID=A0AAD6WPS4_9AGAR|nr:hypothetical protein C8F04DRAFT_1197977 [Mycena alexandri]